MKRKRGSTTPELTVVASDDGAFALVFAPSAHGVCLTRRHVRGAYRTEHSVVLSSREGFERIHSSDPLRFEHQHVYARAKFVLNKIFK